MGFLPFAVWGFHLLMAFNSWVQWPGFVKGAEISILDVLALAVYLSLPRTHHKLPFRLSMAFYFFTVLLSAFQSPVPMASLLYAWQLARMLLVYAVVVKASADERVVPALLTGMVIGLSFEACIAIWERVGLGVLQVGGSLVDKNYLGLMSHFVVFPWFALLLAGQRGWRPILGPLAGVVVEVLTVSRATIGLAAAGYAGLFLLSAVRGWTSRKAILALAGSLAMVVVTPLVVASLEQRFSQHTGVQNDYDERAAFEKAAGMIIADHPFGVGANYYVVIANTEGYNNRAGVAPTAGSDSTNVHNVYLLVAAESGYIGLFAFLIVLLQPLIVAFRCGWRNRGDRRGDLLLGLGASLLIVYIHSYFEWIFITASAQYMFALNAGAIAGLAAQLGYWRRFRILKHSRVDVAVTQIARETQN